MTNYTALAKRISSRLLFESSRITGFSLSKPSYICAKMTMRCNSRCVHCDIWQTDYDEQELTTEQWMHTLDELRLWLGRFSMVFTGGEALLRHDMVDILEHASGLGIEVELLTNGIAVDDQLAESVIASGVSQVTLSWDGFRAETHDRFRGHDGYHEKTAAAVAALAYHRERFCRPVKILLKTVISRNNLAELTELARLAQTGEFNIRYQPIEQNYGETNNPEWFKDSWLWVDDIPFLKEQIGMLKELKAAGAPIDNSAAELDSYVSYFEHPGEMMAAVKAHDISRWSESCRPAHSSFVISSNGDVRMCYMMEPAGNVARTSPRDIWTGRKPCWKGPCGYR